ncbi:MAG: Gfo/Idh/MocA family oxidoreductase [Planctomycetota bacterium]|nr:Gfo/Idh/MocA family oxidoreductase [Planctomycetota bacterium]
MRVALIGARRVRQGLGPFLARFLTDAGAELCAVVGQTRATAAEAARALAAVDGSTPQPVTSLTEVLAAKAEALVIASPHASHEAWLRGALQHGLHVLCEKPLIWGGPEPAAHAADLAHAFHAQDLVLHVNAQWPRTLETFHALHPRAPATPERFFMRMPPRTHGVEALLDALPHPLSVLATLAPGEDAEIRQLQFHAGLQGGPRWELEFTYAVGPSAIACKLELDATPDTQRTTTYALDDFSATRTVDPQTYAMQLSDGPRSIPLPDPTPRLVGSFLAAAAAGRSTGIDPAAIPGMRLLADLVTAAQRLGAPPS